MRIRVIPFGVFTLLLLFWGVLVLGARELSLSMDEPLHIAAGYIYLARWIDGLWFMPQRLPPPLLTALSAIGIFGHQPDIPLENLAGWGENFVLFTDSFMPYLLPLERTEVLARTPIMLLTVLLGALVFRWGRELRGYWAGLLALGLLTFDPLMLAHGRLAHTDVGVTFFGTMALYAGWRWIQHPSWRWNWTTGFFLGLTMLSKFSAVLWLAAWVLMLLYGGMRKRYQSVQYVAQALATFGLAFLLVWASFGFSVGYIPRFPIPLPAPMFWEGAFAQQATADERIFIAFGVQWQGVHWWYFPLNFLIKNPLPLLILLPMGGWRFVRTGWRHLKYIVLLIFPALYTLVAVIAGPNISYRHMLPVHPLMYLVIAVGLTDAIAQAKLPRARSSVLLIVGSILAIWYIRGTLRLFPDELTYFNELVGGPEGGFRYLVDYTQDWGQAFKELRAYLKDHPGPEPQIFYFTHTRLDHYNIPSRRLDCPTSFHPQPGRYVLGPAPLYGLTGPGTAAFDWFRHAHPTAIVGHSLFIYNVTETPVWAAQCTVPVTPMDDATMRSGFGSADIRRADLDCTQSWLYPAGGRQMGVYVLHHALLPLRERCLFPALPDCTPLAADVFIRRHLEGLRLSYEQRSPGILPAFAAYEISYANGPLIPLPRPSPRVALASTSPLKASEVLTMPIPFQGPLAFLSVQHYTEGDWINIETWWQVMEGPITRPLSIMGHLLNGEGELIGQDDGLGVEPVMWQPGDIIVQRHRFPLPPAGTELWLRTGAYWLDTMERWPVAVNGIPGDVIFVPIGR